MIVLVDHRAGDELAAATEWLEKQQRGLGPVFNHEVLQLLDSIEFNPFQFGPVPGSHHQDQYRVAIVRRFRYSVVFKIETEQERVLVLSVEHGHRRPGNWRGRSDTFSP